jgi:pimeloyl-ACP methyl ester carboxylesterase
LRNLLAVTRKGQGEPLVLLHGLATDRRIWGLVVPELARERTVVTLDLPGFGSSSPVGDGFELELVAERVARGLAARGIRGPFDLVGHSLGGGVAITLAALHPRRVRSMVLVAPAGLRPLPVSVAGLLAAGADAVLAARRGAAPLLERPWGRRLLLSLVAADAAAVPPNFARQMVDASAGAQRTAAALTEITTADLRPRLAATHMALGVIWGEADRTVPIRALEELVQARPDARVVTLPDTGHVPMVERPAEFTAALVTLLRGGQPTAAGQGHVALAMGDRMVDQGGAVPNTATKPSDVGITLP